MRTHSLLLRARAVLPVSQPVVHNGAVLIRGNRLLAVGPWAHFASLSKTPALDLGEVVLLPGLVNAHCHLDYTHMAGQFPPPKVFTDWLKVITSTKAGWNLADYTTSWLCGAQMLLRSGTTTVADIEAVPELLPQVWLATPLRVFSFLELLGFTTRRPPQAILREALDKLESLASARCRCSLSPHAPYTTTSELLRLSAQAARRRRWPITIHVAESALEFDMFAHARGEMFTWLQCSGRDMSDCGHGSPVRHLQRCGLLNERLMAVHLNYLARNDAALLAQHAASVVHCPRSHFYFQHHPFPLQRLLKAGVNVCLGTDSLATVCKTRRQPLELDMFQEMRSLAHQQPGLSPKTILRMATLNGARALGMPGQIGALAPGACADLIALPFTGKASGLYDAILQHQGPVAASMVDGQWALPPQPAQPANHPRGAHRPSVVGRALRARRSLSPKPLRVH